jgi:hypothetical protein
METLEYPGAATSAPPAIAMKPRRPTKDVALTRLTRRLSRNSVRLLADSRGRLYFHQKVR